MGNQSTTGKSVSRTRLIESHDSDSDSLFRYSRGACYATQWHLRQAVTYKPLAAPKTADCRCSPLAGSYVFTTKSAKNTKGKTKIGAHAFQHPISSWAVCTIDNSLPFLRALRVLRGCPYCIWLSTGVTYADFEAVDRTVGHAGEANTARPLRFAILGEYAVAI